MPRTEPTTASEMKAATKYSVLYENSGAKKCATILALIQTPINPVPTTLSRPTHLVLHKLSIEHANKKGAKNAAIKRKYGSKAEANPYKVC
ncbi:MAG: hypothetical protein QXP58_02180 [Thermoprotei archaeon]